MSHVCTCVGSRAHAAALHDEYVPPYGPDDAGRLLVVGMAPGEQEARTHTPLVGPAGYRLRQDLLLAELSFDACRRANVANYWPEAHDLANLSEDRRAEGLRTLAIELARGPELVLALGNEALFTLTGCSGITKWRGSLLDTKEGLPPAKVISTIHPSAVLRVWDYRPLFVHDLKKAKRFLEGESVGPPKRDLITRSDPHYTNACADILELSERDDSVIACDIEVFQGKLSCVGFSVHPSWAVSVHADDQEIWREVLAGPAAKVWHNAMYDLTFLEAKCQAEIGGSQHDTMTLWHTLHADLACARDDKSRVVVGRSLALLASLYTNENYYKDELNSWRKVADWEAFYRYNARDAAVTIEVFQAMQAELDDDLRKAYIYKMSLLQPYKEMGKRGIRIDTETKVKKAKETGDELNRIRSKLVSYRDEYNPNSWQQTQKVLRALGAKDGDTKSVNVDDLTKLLIKYEPETSVHQFAKLMLEYREVNKAHGTYYTFDHDPDGRIRTSWDPTATMTGRAASKSSIIFKCNTNIQTIPPPARRFFVADEGYTMFYADLRQAEARIVAYMSGCESLIAAFDTGDPYRTVASWMYDKPVADVTSDERYIAKRCVLGLLYGMWIRTWTAQINIEKGYEYIVERQAKVWYNLFFERFPEIKQFHLATRKLVYDNRSLRTLMVGCRRQFRDRAGSFDEHTFREAYDYVPQGTVPELVNLALLELEPYYPNIWSLAQGHDAILGQVRNAFDADPVSDLLEVIAQTMVRPIEVTDIVHGVTRLMTIPVEIATGQNWGVYNERDNPEGLRKVGEWPSPPQQVAGA